MYKTINGKNIKITLGKGKVLGGCFITFIENGIKKGFVEGNFKSNGHIIGNWCIYDSWFEKYYISNFE